MASLKEDAFVCKVFLLDFFFFLILCEKNNGREQQGKRWMMALEQSDMLQLSI